MHCAIPGHSNLADLTYAAIRGKTVRRAITCSMCGQPLLSGWRNPSPKLLRVGDPILNADTFDAVRAGKEIALSLMQSRLLESLMRRSGRVVSREALIHSVWDSKSDVSENLIEASIYQLRKKLDRDHKVKMIKTVQKLGYTIRDPAKAR
jgi:DNA-binding response OmpR family regulator